MRWMPATHSFLDMFIVLKGQPPRACKFLCKIAKVEYIPRAVQLYVGIPTIVPGADQSLLGILFLHPVPVL